MAEGGNSVDGIEINVDVNTADAVAGLRKTAEAMNAVSQQARQASGGMQTVSQDTQNAANAMTGASQAGQGLVGTLKQIATIAVGVSLSKYVSRVTNSVKSLATESLAVASRAQEMDVVLANLGSRAGYTAKDIKNLVEQVKDMGITTGVAQQAISEAFANQLDPSVMPQLARVAQDAAVLAKADSSATLERIIIGITRQNSLILRNAGLTVMAGQAIEDYADELGVATDSLDSSQRVQAVLNAVLKEGTALTGTYSAAMETAGKQQRSLARHVEETHEQIGGYLIPAYTEWIKLRTRFWKGFKEMVSDGGELTPLLSSIQAITLEFTAFVEAASNDESVLAFRDALIETGIQFAKLAEAAAPAVKLMSFTGIRTAVAILTPIVQLISNLTEAINNSKGATEVFTAVLMAMAAVRVVNRIGDLVSKFFSLTEAIRGARVEAEAMAGVEATQGAAESGGFVDGIVSSLGGWETIGATAILSIGTWAYTKDQAEEAARQELAARQRAEFEKGLRERLTKAAGDGTSYSSPDVVNQIIRGTMTSNPDFYAMVNYWSDTNAGYEGIDGLIQGRKGLSNNDIMDMILAGDMSFIDSAKGTRSAFNQFTGGPDLQRELNKNRADYLAEMLPQLKEDTFAPWRQYLADWTASMEARDEEIRQQNEIGGVESYVANLQHTLDLRAQMILKDEDALWSDLIAGWEKAGASAANAFAASFNITSTFKAAYDEAVKKKKPDPGGEGTKAVMEQIGLDTTTMLQGAEDYKVAIEKGIDPEYIQQLLQQGPANAGDLMHEIATKWDEDSVEAVNVWVRLKAQIADEMRRANIVLRAWGSGFTDPVGELDLNGLLDAIETANTVVGEFGGDGTSSAIAAFDQMKEAYGLNIDDMAALSQYMSDDFKEKWLSMVEYIQMNPLEAEVAIAFGNTTYTEDRDPRGAYGEKDPVRVFAYDGHAQ